MEATENKNEISVELAKAIALKQFNNEDYFMCDGKAYEGKGDETKENYNEDRQFHAEPITFPDWCADNCTEIEPMDESEERDGYMVLTDEEADEKAKEYILDSVWAFTPSFLASFTGFDEDVFTAIQGNGKCESNNSAILSMIEDEDDFVSEAISADGRGHFMNTYDGNENEETVNEQTFYIYRIS